MEAPASKNPPATSLFNPGLNWRRESMRRLVHSKGFRSAVEGEEGLAPSPLPRDSISESGEDRRASRASSVWFPGMEDLSEGDSDSDESDDDEDDVEESSHNQGRKRAASVSRQQVDNIETMKQMFRLGRNETKSLEQFMRWVLRQDDRWHDLWSFSRPDGTMSWKEFEQFAKWEWKWQGPAELVFQLLEEGSCGYITNISILELRRWFETNADLGLHSRDLSV